MQWKEQLLTLTPYQPGRPIESVKREYGLEHIVKLASNENPFFASGLQIFEHAGRISHPCRLPRR